jgi:hypothetical protein
VRRPALAVLVVVAVLVAGCGGGSKAGSASGVPAGASIAPASAVGFVAVNTDAGSTQWKNADALLSKFPIRDKLLKEIETGLSDTGVSFSTDVLPLLGPELDVVLLKDGSGAVQVIGMTQPTDAQKFDAMLEKGTSPSKHVVVAGWTVFSDTQAALTAFQTEADKGRLADDGTYKEATADLPSETTLTAYVNGATAISALESAVPQAGAVPTGQLKWVGAALTTQPDSVKLTGALKSGQLPGQTFKPTLLSHVPSGALLVASFRGGDQLTRQLRQTPAVQQQLGQVQKLLGVSVDQIAALIAGEGVLYVSTGIPYPEVTLVIHQSNQSAAATTLNKLVTRVAAFVNAKVTNAAIPGVKNAKKVAAGPVAIYFGIVDGNLVISDSTAGFRSSASTSITDDPIFQKTSEAAGRPDQSAGFLYVNIKDSVPLLEGLAQLSGATIPPEVSANLAPLQSFLAYATVDKGVAKFAVLVQAR